MSTQNLDNNKNMFKSENTLINRIGGNLTGNPTIPTAHTSHNNINHNNRTFNNNPEQLELT
jgi:hypothetical protein